MATSWIDLASYAAKYGVSQSTLRRRIRTKTIPFHMEKGKYYLEDTPETIQRAPLFSRQNITASLRDQDQDPKTQLLSEENRRLKNQISELETFIKALEAEIQELQTAHGRSATSYTL
ncbi:hypothetical protein GW915_13805 [bacterium]|nr:hypothetical protein [bacterium]